MRPIRPSVQPEPRRGAIITHVAVSLTAILGIAALVLDGGTLIQERRHAQATVDAAALAAAIELSKNGTTDAATTKALSYASSNGFTNDGTNSIITPNLKDANNKPVHGI